jgi:hypothetical protein
MAMINSTTASAAFGVRLDFVLRLKRTSSKPTGLRHAGNIADEASGNKIT